MRDATLPGKFTVLTSDMRVKMTGISAQRDRCRDEGNVKKKKKIKVCLDTNISHRKIYGASKKINKVRSQGVVMRHVIR